MDLKAAALRVLRDVFVIGFFPLGRTAVLATTTGLWHTPPSEPGTRLNEAWARLALVLDIALGAFAWVSVFVSFFVDSVGGAVMMAGCLLLLQIAWASALRNAATKKDEEAEFSWQHWLQDVHSRVNASVAAVFTIVCAFAVVLGLFAFVVMAMMSISMSIFVPVEEEIAGPVFQCRVGVMGLLFMVLIKVCALLGYLWVEFAIRTADRPGPHGAPSPLLAFLVPLHATVLSSIIGIGAHTLGAWVDAIAAVMCGALVIVAGATEGGYCALSALCLHIAICRILAPVMHIKGVRADAFAHNFIAAFAITIYVSVFCITIVLPKCCSIAFYYPLHEMLLFSLIYGIATATVLLVSRFLEHSCKEDVCSVEPPDTHQ